MATRDHVRDALARCFWGGGSGDGRSTAREVRKGAALGGFAGLGVVLGGANLDRLMPGLGFSGFGIRICLIHLLGHKACEVAEGGPEPLAAPRRH
jgi:hypothetical protein